MDTAAAPAFTAFDLVALAVIGLSALLALARGAVREVLSLASWLGAVVAAFALFAPLRPVVRGVITEPLLADVATLVLAFLIPFLAIRVLASLIGRRVDGGLLGPLDKLFGFAFGVFRGVLVVAAAYLVLSFFVAPERQPAAIREARLLPQVRKGAGLVARALPENLENLAIATGAVPPPPEEPPATPAPAPAAMGVGATPAQAAEPGYSDAQRGGVDRLLTPKQP